MILQGIEEFCIHLNEYRSFFAGKNGGESWFRVAEPNTKPFLHDQKKTSQEQFQSS